MEENNDKDYYYRMAASGITLFMILGGIIEKFCKEILGLTQGMAVPNVSLPMVHRPHPSSALKPALSSPTVYNSNMSMY